MSVKVSTSRLRRITAAATVVVAAAACTACGGPGSNGEAAKNGRQIVADAQKATEGATSVHVSGSGTVSNAPLKVDVDAGRGRGGGSIASSGTALDLILDEQAIYLRANEATIQVLTGNATLAGREANRWLQTSITNKIFSSLTSLLDITKLPQTFTFSGVPTKMATTTFAGTSVVPVVDPKSGGTLYVAATGKPYIIAVQGAKSAGAATLTFTDYGTAKVPAAPANPIELNASPSG